MNAIRSKRRPVVEINITPFTDVILVLLVIFMITTPLIIRSGIKVNLPGAVSAKKESGGERLNVVVGADRVIYFEGRAVTKKELRNRIGALRRANPGLQVTLLSDKAAIFNDVAAVLDVMNELGVRHLNIAANPGPGAGSR